MTDSTTVPSAFSDRHIQAVRETFSTLEPIAQQATIVLYTRLFDLDPSLKELVQSDMNEQGRKLMRTVKNVISNLDTMETLAPMLKVLGKRHQGAGFKPAHYDTFGFALIWTLEQSLGEAFTPEVEDACATVYETISATMK